MALAPPSPAATKPYTFKVISGGQTGADQGALHAARKAGIETGGWITKGYLTTIGRCPELAEFGLVEMRGMYKSRSMRNVDDADIVIAFPKGISVGTHMTIGYATTKRWKHHPHSYKEKEGDSGIESKYKPVCVVKDVSSQEERMKVISFIRLHSPKVINVCGSRGEKYSNDIWAHAVTDFLVDVFSELKK
jgi:hypothetical protein